MPWVTIKEQFSEKAWARMLFRIKTDGTLGYYVGSKRHLPGSDEDVFAVFVEKYGSEEILRKYVVAEFEQQFHDLLADYKARVAEMEDVAEDDIQTMLGWLSREECD